MLRQATSKLGLTKFFFETHETMALDIIIKMDASKVSHMLMPWGHSFECSSMTCIELIPSFYFKFNSIFVNF